MMERMEIRDAMESDVPSLATLHEHLHEFHVQREPSLYRSAARSGVETWFRELLAEAGIYVLIGHSGDDAVGYVIARMYRHGGQALIRPHEYLLIDQIVVAPGHRRRGWGRALLEATHDLARKYGFSRVQLDVRAHNQDAVRFYQALGYETVSRRMGRLV